MTHEEALQIAAQCWCDPETSDIPMDARLAEAFARRLVALPAACPDDGPVSPRCMCPAAGDKP